MTSEQSVASVPAARAEIERSILSYLQARLKAAITAEQDLFDRGLVSSMFAMELVVHLEQNFQVSIVGADLQLENFRSIDAMTALVLRLRSDSGH